MLENTIIASVHMLSTDKRSFLGYSNIYKKLLYCKEKFFEDFDGILYYLYATTSEAIKEGDELPIWAINKNRDTIYKFTEVLSPNISKNWDRIVATDDEEITSDFNTAGTTFVPKLPTSFFKPFIEAHNAGKMITEIRLETQDIGNAKEYVEKICTRADNSVIIHPVVEKTYTRAEMERAIHDYGVEVVLGVTDKTGIPYYVDWFNKHYPL